jgi:GNAT superfamily N-acetyltransferase
MRSGTRPRKTAPTNGSKPNGSKHAEATYYYLHVPAGKRPAAQPVEFLPVQQFLEDEDACKTLWELIAGQFHTRSKFLTIWPGVRFVAVHRREGQVAGLLLVSTPLNWQIDYVVVGEEWRHQGIAAALVNETVNQALARRVPYVMLTSRAGLRPLYEGQCGFSVVGEKPLTPSPLPKGERAASSGSGPGPNVA